MFLDIVCWFVIYMLVWCVIDKEIVWFKIFWCVSIMKWGLFNDWVNFFKFLNCCKWEKCVFIENMLLEEVCLVLSVFSMFFMFFIFNIFFYFVKFVGFVYFNGKLKWLVWCSVWFRKWLFEWGVDVIISVFFIEVYFLKLWILLNWFLYRCCFIIIVLGFV